MKNLFQRKNASFLVSVLLLIIIASFFIYLFIEHLETAFSIKSIFFYLYMGFLFFIAFQAARNHYIVIKERESNEDFNRCYNDNSEPCKCKRQSHCIHFDLMTKKK